MRGNYDMIILHIPKPDLIWLNKAISKKDDREYLRLIVVKDGYALATNGHVVHKVKCNAIQENGLYTSEGIKITTESSISHPLQTRDLFDTPFSKNCHLLVDYENLNNYIINKKHGLNVKYFNNATSKAKNIILQLHENEDRVFIQYDNREAIIMVTNR